MASTPLYLLSLRLNRCPPQDYKLATDLEQGVKGQKSTILHRFKVIGEDNLLLKISADDGSDVDNLTSRLPSSITVDYCSPLVSYNAFSEYLHVEKPEGNRVQVGNGLFFWLQFDFGFPGKSIEELKEIWRQEAATALNFKLKAQLDLFKVAGERKVHVFIQAPAEKVDDLSFSLPIVRGLGDCVTIVSKAVKRY